MDSYLRIILYWALLFGMLMNKGELKNICNIFKKETEGLMKSQHKDDPDGYAKPSDPDGPDYASDDYQNDDEDSNDEKEYNGPPPKILSSSLTLTVKEGDNVYLPCHILHGDTYTVMWKNGSQTLFVEEMRLVDDRRLERLPNNTIIIHSATMYDSGTYSCQVSTSPVTEVNHVVSVVSSPEIIRLLPHVPAGQSKIMKKGESLTLACEVKGYPKPTVTWTRRSHKHFPNGHEKMTGTSITFEEVNRKYSGIYECEAVNEFGKAKKSVEIHVHYQPEIEIEEETVTTALGFQPEITCTVHAEPKAEVKWYKNGDVVTKNSRVSTTAIGNKHTLTITDVNEHDFGSYTCHAFNELGRNKKSIVLSGAPTKPKVRLSLSEDGKGHEIDWTAESYIQVTEVEVQFKRLEDERWTTTTSTVATPKDSHTYMGKEVIKFLPPGEYVLRVRTKNLHGWSHFSTEETFNGDFLVDEAYSAAAEVAQSMSGTGMPRPMTIVQSVIVLSLLAFLM